MSEQSQCQSPLHFSKFYVAGGLLRRLSVFVFPVRSAEDVALLLSLFIRIDVTAT